MENDHIWSEKQQELSDASRNAYWLRTLSPEKRAILGKVEYRRQCRLAKQRLKMADEACLMLRRERLRRAGAHRDEMGERSAVASGSF